jgi:hypothetical protein
MNINNFKKFTLDHEIIVSHNFVHYPSHLQVNIIPDDYKEKLLSDLTYLRQDEIERLRIELFKPKNEDHVRRFFSFITLLDKKRNVEIGNYLEEWKEPFNRYNNK